MYTQYKLDTVILNVAITGSIFVVKGFGTKKKNKALIEPDSQVFHNEKTITKQLLYLSYSLLVIPE